MSHPTSKKGVLRLLETHARFCSVAAFAYNKRRQIMAVAERGTNPVIYMYSYTDHQLLGDIPGSSFDFCPLHNNMYN